AFPNLKIPEFLCPKPEEDWDSWATFASSPFLLPLLLSRKMLGGFSLARSFMLPSTNREFRTRRIGDPWRQFLEVPAGDLDAPARPCTCFLALLQLLLL